MLESCRYVGAGMAKQNEHGKLIAAAAKAALTPLGCVRKGQSRFWYSDQRFWAISIEFQPSGWSKGSYLNVGAMWFWYPKKSWSFDVGHRVDDADFISFESVGQFTPLIERMAERAAQEVIALREQFKSIGAIHRYLISHPLREGAPVYHAAVAAALAGDMPAARQSFDRLAHWPTENLEWRRRLQSNGAALATFLDDPPKFRSEVLVLIEGVRERLRLPPDPQCLEAMDSTGAT